MEEAKEGETSGGEGRRTEADGLGSLYGDYQLYNVQVTSHGLVMLFGFIVPITTGGFGNFFVPMLVGLPDMVFPRANVLSYLLYVLGGQLLLASQGVEEGVGAGWTLYPTLVCAEYHTSSAMEGTVISIHVLGLSSLLNSVNMLITILIGARRGIPAHSLSPFLWSVVFTSVLLVAILPVLAAGVSLVLLDRTLSSCFFDVLGGGDVLMYQHIFWFFGHPEVYVIILPVFGLVSFVAELALNKPVFSSLGMVYSMASISLIGFFVWAHHMFTVGMDLDSRGYFGSITVVIGVPTAIKLFNWLHTLSLERVCRVELYYLGLFLLMFVLGGLSGLLLANVALDVQLHDSYFVVAHFHYVLSLGAVVGTLTGIYGLSSHVFKVELYYLQLR